MTDKTCNDCNNIREQFHINWKLSEEETRRQIKGNLMLACDTWDIENLLNLERAANEMVMGGIATQGLLYNGLMQTVDLIFDKQGKMKLSSNPDDENSAYRVLAKMLQEQATAGETIGELPFDEPVAEQKAKDDYSTFFF